MAPGLLIDDCNHSYSHNQGHGMPSRVLRIGIIGGGLAGAAAAGAFSRLPNVQVKVYERSPVIREAGAQIAVMVTAIKVLRRMLSPAAWNHLEQNLYRGKDADGIQHRHWRTGEVLLKAISPHTPRYLQEGRTSRVSLHRTLMMDVPEGVVEYGHEVARVETRRNDVGRSEAVLHFKGGHSTAVDLVVAADGLYSKIRRQYLPETDVKYKGLVAYRINFPSSLVSHIKDLPDDSSSYRRGPNIVILSRLEPGVYSFAAFLQEPEEFAQTLRWEHALGQPGIERLKGKVKGWHRIVEEVVAALPAVDAYPLHAAKWLENLVRDDCAAFVGDAAHPTAGGWGTGSAFCFSDVWALYRSLQRTYNFKSPSKPPTCYDIPYALHLFNETRRHFLLRVERQFEYDRLDGLYVTEALDDDEEFARRYRERYTLIWWILEHDVDIKWQEVEAEERHRYYSLAKQNALR